MATYYSPKIVTDNLVMYLDAANPKSYPGSGSTWFDLSGNGRNATKAGSQSPSYPQYNSNGWFTFTGGIVNDNYSRFDVSIPSLNAITVFLWHYSTQSGGTALRMSSSSFEIGANGYTAGVNYNDVQIAGDRTTTLNTWVCDCLTFSGTTLIGYRNAIQVGTATRASTSLASGTLRIGTRDDLYSQHYVGSIAMVQIYGRVLNPNEILQNFDSSRGRFGI